MIHEFAVEPELLVDWSKSTYSFALFVGSFGLGEPRVLSLYPTDWKDLAKKHWEEHEAQATTEEERGKLELQRVRFVELFRRLSETMVNRTTLQWVRARTWLENAITHAPRTLQRIVVRHAPGAPEYVLAGDGLVEHPRWILDKAKFVARDATLLAEAVASLLQCCDKIVFVDPYYHPSGRHRGPFRLFFEALKSRTGLGQPSRIEILTSCEERGSWNEFESACRGELLPLLPVGWRLRVAWLRKNGSRGDRLHNRYILTELGGISFGVGLDSADATQTDDLSLLSRPQHEWRWGQYAGPNPEFEVDGTNQVTLVGVANTARVQRRSVFGRGGRR